MFWRTIKRIAKLLLPPIVTMMVKHLVWRIKKSAPEWEYVPEGWRAASEPAIKGWSEHSIVQAQLTAWPAFLKSLDGVKPFGLSPEAHTVTVQANISFHNVIMSYAYALSVAAHDKRQLRVLDWGGGLGHYYLLTRMLRPDLKIDYFCKDLPAMAQEGRHLLPSVTFFADDAWEHQHYDFVFASSSIQYMEDWQTTLKQLAAVTSGYLYITRLPTVQNAASYVMVQRPYQYGYNTEYLGWCLNRGEVIGEAEALGLELVREFLGETPPYIHGAPEQCTYWGFLWKKP